MGSLTIEPVAKSDQARVIATLVSAFIADPVERWLYPQLLAYLTEFPAFVAAFGGEAFEKETVWSLPEFSAVAIWLPPGVEADADAIVTVLSKSASPDKALGHLQSSSRWTPPIPTIPTGTCPGLGSIAPAKEPAYSDNVWRASTPITVPPSLKRPIREPCRSANATGSESPASPRLESVRP